ncbi:MAG: polysaccharide deacetylase family protein [Bacteroidales bacterium]
MKLLAASIIYIIAIIIIFLLPIDISLKFIFGSSTTLLFIIILTWASVDINSQFYLRTICKNKSDKNKVAITFDDGPDPDKTLKILNVLDNYNVKATFFIIGKKAEENPGLVKLIAKSGHLIGNHSYSHSNVFPLKSTKRIRNEILRTQEIIKENTGKENIYFRPPFGITNPLIASAVKSLNLTTIGWSIRSFDTMNKEPQKIINRIKKRLRGGDIILLHDINSTELLKNLLEELDKKRLKAVRIDEIINN